MNSLRWLSLLLLAIAIAGCANHASAQRSPLSIDQLISTPEAFQGKTVVVDACLLVTIHGMSLYNCTYKLGDRDQLVSFDPIAGGNDTAYQRLVDSGFEGFAVPKHTVRANISGVYKYREDELPHYVLLISDVTNLRKIYDEK